MSKRSVVSKRVSKKVFRKTASRPNKMNTAKSQRGGIRL